MGGRKKYIKKKKYPQQYSITFKACCFENSSLLDTCSIFRGETPGILSTSILPVVHITSWDTTALHGSNRI